MTTSPGKKQSEGFTLFEILIAIAIFAIVVTMLFSSHILILSNTESVQEGMATAEMAQNCINRMVADLQSIYLTLPPVYEPPEFDTPPEDYRLVGDTTTVGDTPFSRLRFTSSAHLPLGLSIQADGIAEIIYYVQETQDHPFVIRRADNLYPYEPFEEFEENENDPVLCEDISALAFKYFDEEGTEYDVWDSESSDTEYATPRIIGISIGVGDAAAPKLYQTKIMLPLYRGKIE
ncbi:MAG: prepilin-type N-terminal cleavage/methylation domain-containing protein [Desulfobacterales bacterium]